MEIHVKMLKFEDFCCNFHRQNGRHTKIIQLKKEVEKFSDKSVEVCTTISDKMMEIHRKTVKFEDFYGNFHRHNDRLTKTIRMKLKKEIETIADKTEDFHLTYVC